MRCRLGALAAGLVVAGMVPGSAAADTLHVTAKADNLANDGKCSLREAVSATDIDASVNGADDCRHGGGTGPDRIVLPAGSFPVKGAAGDQSNASGDLDILAGAGLAIEGKSRSKTKLIGDVDRVLDQRSGDLILSNLSLIGGDAGGADGGGALDEGAGRLVLKKVGVSGNDAAYGGGVSVRPIASRLVVDRSRISGNTTDSDGAGISSSAPVKLTHANVMNNTSAGVSADGGGIRLDDTGKIVDSTFDGNSTMSGDGGAIAVTPGVQPIDLTIINTTIADNHSDLHRDGGIEYDGDGTLRIVRSTISGNTAKSGGAGIETSDDDDAMVVRSSVISGNVLTSSSNEVIGGAAITADGPTKVSTSVIAHNKAESPSTSATALGGAIRAGEDLRINRSTLSANRTVDDAALGGAVYQDAGNLTISNSTLAFNRSDAGGALDISLDASAVIYNTTFARNDATAAGAAILAGSGGIAGITASVIADGPNACDGTVLTAGYNLDQGSSCPASGPRDLSDAAPGLKKFGAYGGPKVGSAGHRVPLRLFGLRRRSKAVNREPKSQCEDDLGPLRVDERGAKRPSGKRCDSGSFELQLR